MRCLDGENRVGDRDPQKDPSYGPWEGRSVEGGKSLSGREEGVAHWAPSRCLQAPLAHCISWVSVSIRDRRGRKLKK